MGLALCYSIVQAHGGRIDVESHVGLGTAFTITVPGR
ncbi:MAG TPA: ATP-binding protein [Symbiobacteriaceae bacterium]|nr:ATP-binding protein [Symbiobacteriaceae bacterium]